MSNKFEQLEIIRRFIDKTIENNFFPELEGVSVASIAEASRKTGLAPNLIYRLLLSEELKIDGLVVSVKKEKLPKQQVGRAKITLVKRPQDTKRNDTKERRTAAHHRPAAQNAGGKAQENRRNTGARVH